MPPDHAPAAMVANIAVGLATFGIDLHVATNLVHTVRCVPVGTWPRDLNLKTIGLYTRSVICDGLQAIPLGPLTRGLK